MSNIFLRQEYSELSMWRQLNRERVDGALDCVLPHYQGCNNMPVMLIRVIRDCNVRSDFYDVNRVLFKDGRVLSRFLIMVAAVQWYFSPHTNPWTPKVGWMQDKFFIYLFDLRLVRDAKVFAPQALSISPIPLHGTTGNSVSRGTG